jgi:hypothetical protein
VHSEWDEDQIEAIPGVISYDAPGSVADPTGPHNDFDLDRFNRDLDAAHRRGLDPGDEGYPRARDYDIPSNAPYESNVPDADLPTLTPGIPVSDYSFELPEDDEFIYPSLPPPTDTGTDMRSPYYTPDWVQRLKDRYGDDAVRNRAQQQGLPEQTPESRERYRQNLPPGPPGPPGSPGQ